MSDNTVALLRELAAKLGTTVEHLYAVLLRQVPIWIASNCVYAAILFALSWVVGLIGWRLWTTDPDSGWADPFIPERFCAALLFIAATGLMLIGVDFVGEAITGIVNPEFSVLTYIADHIR